jgi:hypothetical protein
VPRRAGTWQGLINQGAVEYDVDHVHKVWAPAENIRKGRGGWRRRAGKGDGARLRI